MVDWKEVRDLANREIPSPVYLLQTLHDAGIQGVLFSPLTLKEAIRGPMIPRWRSVRFPLNARSLGEQALDELTRRGVSLLAEARSQRRSFYAGRVPRVISQSLGDVEIGYDKNLLEL